MTAMLPASARLCRRLELIPEDDADAGHANRERQAFPAVIFSSRSSRCAKTKPKTGVIACSTAVRPDEMNWMPQFSSA